MADARPHLERSGVSNAVTGASEDNSIRTSSGMFFDRNATALVSRIERRVAAWSLLPPGNQEGLQVLRYEPSEKYGPHHDYFSFKGAAERGGRGEGEGGERAIGKQKHLAHKPATPPPKKQQKKGATTTAATASRPC